MLSGMGGNRTALLSVAGASLLVVVFAASGGSPVPSTVNDFTIEPGLPSRPVEGAGLGPRGALNPGADPEVVGNALVWLLVGLCVLALVTSALSFLRRQRRAGSGQVLEHVEGTIDPVPRRRLRAAVVEARDILARQGGRPRDAVIEAWVALEHAAEHKREPHETATEFTVALLEKENADEAALRELRTLYQRARFGRTDSDTDSDTDTAARARDALDRILATIR